MWWAARRSRPFNLGPGDDQNLVFENLKMPRLTVTKIDAEDSKPIPGTVFTVEGIDSDSPPIGPPVRTAR